MDNAHAVLFSARYARAGVQAFLKGVASFSGGGTNSHDAWLPPLTADLLLQPHLGLFPFPSYFRKLHEFLAAFYHSGRVNDLLHLIFYTCRVFNASWNYSGNQYFLTLSLMNPRFTFNLG